MPGRGAAGREGARARGADLIAGSAQDPPATVQAAGSSCDRIPTKEGELTNKDDIAASEPLRDKPNLCAQDPKPNPNPNPLRSGP